MLQLASHWSAATTSLSNHARLTRRAHENKRYTLPTTSGKGGRKGGGNLRRKSTDPVPKKTRQRRRGARTAPQCCQAVCEEAISNECRLGAINSSLARRKKATSGHREHNGRGTHKEACFEFAYCETSKHLRQRCRNEIRKAKHVPTSL